MDIYVGNLAYKSTDDDLRTLFAQHGEVASARVVINRATGQSKGFGFIEMPSQEEALKAIDAINGAELHGRRLRVNESQPKPPREDRRGPSRARGNGNDYPPREDRW